MTPVSSVTGRRLHAIETFDSPLLTADLENLPIRLETFAHRVAPDVKRNPVQADTNLCRAGVDDDLLVVHDLELFVGEKSVFCLRQLKRGQPNVIHFERP